MTKTVVVVIVVVFIVFYIVTSPGQAANIAHNGWDGAVNVAHGIGQFFDKLSS